MNGKKELTAGQTTILMSSDKVTFYSACSGTFATFYIPDEFADTAADFYDLYLEQGCPTVFLSCRKGYDIAIHLDVKSGKMIDWHYTK